MTTLSITPNWKQKTAKFRGAIAAGEHVAVSIANDDGTGNAFISSTANLRLSVIDPTTGRLLATFPEPVEEGETPDTWGNDPTPLACTLNLNTVQMLKAVPPAANVQLLFVLDAYNEETPEFTLYFKDMCEVTHWPRRVGEEEPVDLDGYKDFVEETEAAIEAFGVRIAAAETSVTVAERAATNAAQDAERSAASAASSAQTAAAVASGKVDKAELFDNPGSVGQKVKATWLPSYVDDVLEFASRSGFPASGEGGKIYIALDTGKVYRWGGSEYVEIANPDLSGYKTKQTAVADPAASGTGLAFIDSITQNANGEITVTKKTVAVDAALSASSEKPVANMTVKAAVDALDSAKQAKLYTQGEPSWTFSTESTGTEIEAFMANAANYSVTEEQDGSDWLYTLTGYDEESYYVAPVGRTEQSTSIPFYVFDVTQASMYGSVLAEYSSGQSDVPAQVDTTPTANSGRLVTSGGVHEATADAVKYVADKDGNKTAVTIGSRADGDVGRKSLSVGENNFVRHRALSIGKNNTVWDQGFACGQDNTVGSAAGSSFAAGEDNVVPTYCSGVIGRYLQTSNDYEVAIGKYNVSRNGSGAAADTRLSVGIGSTRAGRRNAMEVMRSGTVYVLGVGGYEGTTAGAMGDDLATVISAISEGKANKSELPYGSNASESDLFWLVNRAANVFDLWDPHIDSTGSAPQITVYAHPSWSSSSSSPCVVDPASVVVSGDKIEADFTCESAAYHIIFGTAESYAGGYYTYYATVEVKRNVTPETVYSGSTSSVMASLDTASITLEAYAVATVTFPIAWERAVPGSGQITLVLPAAVAGKSRDFDFALYKPSGASVSVALGSGETVTLIDEFGAAFSFAIASGWNVWHFTEFSPGLFRVESCGGASAIKAALDGKQATLSSAQLAAIAAVPDKADKSELPYALGTPTTIDTASSETVEGETVYYGAATLDNRTANIVQVTAATALDELRITFPAATSGKVRDFGLRVEIGTGSAALTAPAIVPVAPTGETITLENADGAIPALADGTATAKGVTLLYFSETVPGVFVVKGEEAKEVE